MPNENTIELNSELAAMIDSLKFSHYSADQTSNAKWIVRATHSPCKTPGKFNAAICIFPKNRFARAPVGLPIKLESKTDEMEFRLERTNALGQAWFRGLSPGHYQARSIDTARSEPDTEGRGNTIVAPDRFPDTETNIFDDYRERGQLPKGGALAADTGGGGEKKIPCETPPDSGVIALVQIGGQGAVVQVATKNPAIMNATVRFRIGSEEIEIPLVEGSGEKFLLSELPDNFEGQLGDFRIDP
jgi:hypothetical protein